MPDNSTGIRPGTESNLRSTLEAARRCLQMRDIEAAKRHYRELERIVKSVDTVEVGSDSEGTLAHAWNEATVSAGGPPQGFQWFDALGTAADAVECWLGNHRSSNDSDAEMEAVCGELRLLADRIKLGSEPAWYREDIAHDLEEMATTLQHGCHRASMAMAGRVLELTMKVCCQQHGLTYDDHWMVGKLFEVITSSGVYLEPSMKSIWSIINTQRIASVHSKSAVPIPSRAQALMVSHAIMDSVRRVFEVAE